MEINRFSLKNIAIFLFLFIVLINNLTYDKTYQINQVLLNFIVFLIFLLLLIFRMSVGRILAYYVIVLLFSIYSVSHAVDASYINRLVNYSLIIFTFFLIFYTAKLFDSKSMLIFYIYTFVFLLVAIMVVIYSDRGIVNPNWVAMSFFYMVAIFLYSYDKKLIYLVLTIGFFISFFVFESRGASVSFLVAILVMTSLFISVNLTRVSVFIILSLIATSYFLFLDFYLNNRLMVDLFISQYSERGLGGREGVFLIGYEMLQNSNYIGYGLGMSGGFEDQYSEKGVHIHFGLLDLSLKFSIIVVPLYIFLLYVLINNIDENFLPFIAGGLMTVYYYNGLAPSHLGLNFMLYFLLGLAFYKSRLHTQNQLNN